MLERVILIPVRFLATMRSNVIVVMTGGGERFGAYLTSVWFLARVQSDVVHETNTRGQDLVTMWTLELLT